MSPLGSAIGVAAAAAGFAVELGSRWWIRRRNRYYVWAPGLRLELRQDPGVFPEVEPRVRFEVNADGERGSDVRDDAPGLVRVLVAGGGSAGAAAPRHTQRVTDITVRLAVMMNVPDEMLVHIRRGALLHDIGKMGIPDSILLKPGPLNVDEWDIMRQHPVYAFNLLAPITNLGLALEIPYSHHEKWDGSGYPQGLKGEQIPLAARVFAVVDVWDALRNDRPYRLAWPDRRGMEDIHSENGKHFDPRVGENFLKLL